MTFETVRGPLNKIVYSKNQCFESGCTQKVKKDLDLKTKFTRSLSLVHLQLFYGHCTVHTVQMLDKIE